MCVRLDNSISVGTVAYSGSDLDRRHIGNRDAFVIKEVVALLRTKLDTLVLPSLAIDHQ